MLVQRALLKGISCCWERWSSISHSLSLLGLDHPSQSRDLNWQPPIHKNASDTCLFWVGYCGELMLHMVLQWCPSLPSYISMRSRSEVSCTSTVCFCFCYFCRQVYLSSWALMPRLTVRQALLSSVAFATPDDNSGRFTALGLSHIWSNESFISDRGRPTHAPLYSTKPMPADMTTDFIS